jgi:hypothetical protein
VIFFPACLVRKTKNKLNLVPTIFWFMPRAWAYNPLLFLPLTFSSYLPYPPHPDLESRKLHVQLQCCLEPFEKCHGKRNMFVQKRLSLAAYGFIQNTSSYSLMLFRDFTKGLLYHVQRSGCCKATSTRKIRLVDTWCLERY